MSAFAHLRRVAERRVDRAAARLAVAATVALTLGAGSAAAQATGATQPPAASAAGGHANHAGHGAAQGAEASRAHGKASHGGQVLMLGQQHVEFVATPDGVLSVWLTDRTQKPLPAPAGASVTLTSGANTVTLPLAPDAARQHLTARFDAATYKTFTAAVQLPGAEGRVRTVRFNVPATQ